MMNLLSHIRRASPSSGLAPALFLLVLFILSPIVSAQTGKRPRVTDSILGVGIGASLEAVREKLERLSIAIDRANKDEDEDKDEGGHKQVWKLKGTNYTYI